MKGLPKDCSAEDERAAKVEAEPIAEEIEADLDLGDEEDW